MDTVFNKRFVDKRSDMYQWCLIVNACAHVFLNIFLVGFFVIPVMAICTLCGAIMAGEDKEPWRRRIDDCLQAFRDTNIDGITY